MWRLDYLLPPSQRAVSDGDTTGNEEVLRLTYHDIRTEEVNEVMHYIRAKLMQKARENESKKH